MRHCPLGAGHAIAAGDFTHRCFTGHAFSIAVELERQWRLGRLKSIDREHVDLVLEDTDSPSKPVGHGQNDVLCGCVRSMWRAVRQAFRGCGCGRRQTICASTRRMRWHARWICVDAAAGAGAVRTGSGDRDRFQVSGSGNRE